MGAHTLIVGAGASGAVIASRLTERADLTVTLVEAGPDYGGDLPEDLANGTHNSMTAHDWGYTHAPTPTMPQMALPRGRVVGGSSAVNTCIGLRGQPEDYDEWEAMGLEGWGWQACLEAFIRLERDLDFPDAPWHGSDGPLPLRRHTVDELVPWQAAFLEACDQLGFPACDDTNRPGSTGWSCHAMNKIDGRRISAAEAWLTPEVRQRENLSILPRTQVHRIRFHGDRAVGLEVEQDGQRRFIEGKRVILCAGAIGTPGLLLRSGIGPREDLARLNVPVKKAVPSIGSQLFDHGSNALFFWPRRRARVGADAPLIQTVLRTKLGDGPWLNDVQIQAGSVIPTPWGIGTGTMLMQCLSKPKSVGRLHFTDLDPSSAPVIDSRLHTHPDDLELATAGLGLCHEISNTPALRRLGRGFYPTRAVSRSKRLLRRWIPMSTDSGYHPCGTVPMGKATDARGRIDGIDGLRVADASLFPSVPSSNIHLPTLMLGERFGVWLRADLD